MVESLSAVSAFCVSVGELSHFKCVSCSKACQAVSSDASIGHVTLKRFVQAAAAGDLAIAAHFASDAASDSCGVR